jgi:hypothetical protein
MKVAASLKVEADRIKIVKRDAEAESAFCRAKVSQTNVIEIARVEGL